MTSVEVSDKELNVQNQPQFRMSYIWLICLVAAMGGLLFGYDWVVIGGAKPFFEPAFGLSTASERGWANSCALVGCLLGALLSGGLSDRFGRKRLLVLAALLFTITSIGTALAADFRTFVAWRIAGGVAIGLASNLSPMYIAEVSPAAVRGMFVSINQLTIITGIAVAQVVNYLIAEAVPADATAEFIRNSWNGTTGWRWMFGVTAVPSFLFLVFMFIVPESPRWLAKNGKHQKARKVLAKIGGDRYADQSLADIEADAGRRGGKGRFPRASGTENDEDPLGRRRAGRVPAMVRHQRDLQLRGGDFSGRRLRSERHAAEHRGHRGRVPPVHVRGHLHRRPAGTPAADDGRRRGTGADLRGPRRQLSDRTHRRPRAGLGAGGHGLLFVYLGPDHLGDPLRNLSQSDPRRGDVGFGVRPCGRAASC